MSTDLTAGVLLTDQYQLTMAQLYFQQGMHEQRAQFEHFFRDYPDYGSHQAGYAINAGLETLLDWIGKARFGPDEIAALRSQTHSAGSQLFGDDFLAWLESHGSFEDINLRAIPEGRVVHPNVPLTVVEGPLAMVQILETALLNHLNYQTLIATKASRLAEAARGRPILEFGLRRSASLGGNAATRAALIGGAAFSSNVGMSHALGLPPKGTHAHSMIQAFTALGQTELDAFRAYAATYPDDCLLLVDTYDTIASGVPNAITVFDELRSAGHTPVGIRLDSGDLAYLAIQSARLLNEAGHDDAQIVLSSGLDELITLQIFAQINQEAANYGVDPQRLINRLVLGVGSNLSTSEGQPYLSGVYKLVALDDGGAWVPAIKVSDSPAKTMNPGEKDTYRVYDKRGRATADLLTIGGEALPADQPLRLQHPLDSHQHRDLAPAERSRLEPLLEPVLVDGERVGDAPSLDDMRKRRTDDVACLDPGVRRLVNPHTYHVSLTSELWDLKNRMMSEARR